MFCSTLVYRFDVSRCIYFIVLRCTTFVTSKLISLYFDVTNPMCNVYISLYLKVQRNMYIMYCVVDQCTSENICTCIIYIFYCTSKSDVGIHIMYTFHFISNCKFKKYVYNALYCTLMYKFNIDTYIIYIFYCTSIYKSNVDIYNVYVSLYFI